MNGRECFYQAAMRKLALLTTLQNFGRPNESALLNFSTMTVDPYFECVVDEVMQTKVAESHVICISNSTLIFLSWLY